MGENVGAKECHIITHPLVSPFRKGLDTVGELGSAANGASPVASLKAQALGESYAETSAR